VSRIHYTVAMSLGGYISGSRGEIDWGGDPLLPSTASRPRLELTGHRVYKTGIVSLQYDVAQFPKLHALAILRPAGEPGDRRFAFRKKCRREESPDSGHGELERVGHGRATRLVTPGGCVTRRAKVRRATRLRKVPQKTNRRWRLTSAAGLRKNHKPAFYG
jgi:hypothetical protein